MGKFFNNNRGKKMLGCLAGILVLFSLNVGNPVAAEYLANAGAFCLFVLFFIIFREITIE